MAADEQQLIERVRDGDSDAFDRCVRLHGDRVQAIAYQLTGNAEDARDVAQEVFVRLLHALDRFDPQQRFTTWLYRVTVNLAIDFQRRRQRRSPEATAPADAAETVDDPAPGPHDRLESGELIGAVRRLAGRLPEQQRRVFVLRDLQGLDTGEIAVILSCRESTVRVHLARARSRIREVLCELYPEFSRGGA